MPSKKKKKPSTAAQNVASPSSTSAASASKELPAEELTLNKIEALSKVCNAVRERDTNGRALIMYKALITKGEDLLARTPEAEVGQIDVLHKILASAYFHATSLNTLAATAAAQENNYGDSGEDSLDEDEIPIDQAELEKNQASLWKAIAHFEKVTNKPADGHIPLHHALALGDLARIQATLNSDSVDNVKITMFNLSKASIKDAQAAPIDKDATPFILLAHALAKVEESITKYKIQLLLSLRDQSSENVTLAQSEAAQGLENAYEAPGHFITISIGLDPSQRLAIAEHVIEMSDGFQGEEGKVLKAEATLEIGDTLADLVEDYIGSEDCEEEASKAIAGKLKEEPVYRQALEHLRKAVKLYQAIIDGEDPDDEEPEIDMDQMRFQLGHALLRLEDLLPESQEKTDLVKQLEKLDLDIQEGEEEWEDEDEDEDGTLSDVEEHAHSSHSHSH